MNANGYGKPPHLYHALLCKQMLSAVTAVDRVTTCMYPCVLSYSTLHIFFPHTLCCFQLCIFKTILGKMLLGKGCCMFVVRLCFMSCITSLVIVIGLDILGRSFQTLGDLLKVHRV